MKLVSLHSKDTIEAVLRRNVCLNLYAIGDLDDFFWPHTVWYGLEDAGSIVDVALLYVATGEPVLLALGEPGSATMSQLVRKLQPLLPARFYSHVNPELIPLLSETHKPHSHGLHYKMALTDPARLDSVDTSQVVPLLVSDLAEAQRLYAESYPGNWFDARMLQTGCYCGIRTNGRLVSIAGVHVYSPAYRVAALGNITTHPDFRGRGLGKAVTAGLCKVLLQSVEHVALNVQAMNAPALTCYEAIGFKRVAEYEECAFEPGVSDHLSRS